MRRNTLRDKLKAGEPIINGWLAIPSAYSAEVLGHQGYDSVTVDLQHGMIGFDAAIPMLQALSSTPAVPLVRVSKNDYALVMQLLDAGAYGVICPMISSAADAALFASFCRYPPVGQRSFGPVRGLLYGGADYFAHANGEILTLPMIETQEAVTALDDILATPGIDGIYVGPNDLCLAYGVPPEPESNDPAMAATVIDIARRTRAKGKIAGIFCSSGAGAKRRVSEDFNMVTPGNDSSLLVRAAKDAIAAVRPVPASPPSSRTGY